MTSFVNSPLLPRKYVYLVSNLWPPVPQSGDNNNHQDEGDGGEGDGETNDSIILICEMCGHHWYAVDTSHCVSGAGADTQTFRTFRQTTLISSAVHISIDEVGVRDTKETLDGEVWGTDEAERSADNIGISIVPAIVTDWIASNIHIAWCCRVSTVKTDFWVLKTVLVETKWPGLADNTCSLVTEARVLLLMWTIKNTGFIPQASDILQIIFWSNCSKSWLNCSFLREGFTKIIYGIFQ